MTNEQLTEEVIRLSEHQAQIDANYQSLMISIAEVKEDVKTTKNLAEDVHIMAINMANMEKTLTSTSKKVDTLSQQEFNRYKEDKKQIRSNIISAIVSSCCTAAVGLIVWLITQFTNQGGI